MTPRLLKILREDKRKQLGATMVEYALLVALVALIAMAGVRSTGLVVGYKFQDATEKVAAAGGFPSNGDCHPGGDNWPACQN